MAGVNHSPRGLADCKLLARHITGFRDFESGRDLTGGWFLWATARQSQGEGFLSEFNSGKGKERKAYGYDTRGYRCVCFLSSFLFPFFSPFKVEQTRSGVRCRQAAGEKTGQQRTGSLLFSERLDVLFWEWGGRLYDEPLLGLVDDTTRQRSDIE